jgi:Right handed beta helix region
MEVLMKLAPKLNVVGMIMVTAIPAALASLSAGNANAVQLPSCSAKSAVKINGRVELDRKISGASKSSVVCFKGDFSNTKMTIRTSGTYRFQGATFKSLVVLANDVVIDGIHVNAQGDRNPGIATSIKGNRIVVNNSLFENVAGTIMTIGGSDVTIQNSVFKDIKPQPRRDRHCIYVQPGAHRLKVLNNSIYDCAGDGLQIAPNGSGPKDVVIANNNMYITRKMIRSNGKSCAEGALDFKGGRGVLVQNNTMHGFRPTDKNCGGTGAAGVAVVVHGSANNYTFDGNKAYDVSRCYVVKTNNKINFKDNNMCKTAP